MEWNLAEARLYLGECLTIVYQCKILATHAALASYWRDMRVETSLLWPDLDAVQANKAELDGDQLLADVSQKTYSGVDDACCMDRLLP